MNNLEIFADAGNAVANGIFIPVSDLAGLELSELTSAPDKIEGYLAYGLLNSIYDAILTLAPLGFPEPEKSSPTGTGPGKYTESVTFRIQRLIDLRTNQVSLPGLPNTGSYTGQGGLQIDDIWPNAIKVAANGAVSTGVVIPDSWVTQYGAAIPASVATDARPWIAALIVAINHTLAVRTTTVASAIVRKTTPEAVRPTGPTIPAAYYDATNPNSSITTADLPFLRMTLEAIAIEYEILAEAVAQTFEINVATL